MLIVTNKLSINDIAKIINVPYEKMIYATRILGTIYEQYFSEIPKPTFIEKRYKYYDSAAVEKFRQFFKMDKIQKRIFNSFIEQYRSKNIKYM